MSTFSRDVFRGNVPVWMTAAACVVLALSVAIAVSDTSDADPETASVTITGNIYTLGLIDGEYSMTYDIPVGSVYYYVEKDNQLVFTYEGEPVRIVQITFPEAPEHYYNTIVDLMFLEGTITGDKTITLEFRQFGEKVDVVITSSNPDIGRIMSSDFALHDSMTVEMRYGDTWQNRDGILVFNNDSRFGAQTLIAPEHHRYDFTGWSEFNGTVGVETVITAYFEEYIDQYTVKVFGTNDTIGTVDKSQLTIDYGTTWEADGLVLRFSDGQTVTATLLPNPAQSTYHLESWSPAAGTVTEDCTIEARFGSSVATYDITVYAYERTLGQIQDKEGRLSDTFTVKADYGTIYYVEGDTIYWGFDEQSFKAVPNVSSVPGIDIRFVGWSGDTATVRGNVELHASFVAVLIDVQPDEKGNTSIVAGSEQLRISEDVIQALKSSAGSFTATVNGGSVTFDHAAVGRILSEGDIAISEITDGSVLAKVSSARKVISVDFGSNHDFSGGKLSISIPYALSAGEDPEDICIGYVNGNRVEKIDATYNSETDCVEFEVDHLSTFAVLHSDFFADEGYSIGFYAAMVIIAVLSVGLLSMNLVRSKQ